MSSHGSSESKLPLASVLQLCGGPPLCNNTLTLLSGGAEGVDTCFDDAMAEFAPSGQCIHWSFAGHTGFAARIDRRVDIPSKLAEQLCDPHLQAAATQLRQSIPSRKNWHVLSLFRRNVLQALWADAMFAVTWEDMDARYPLRIGGGTKWAAQVYVNRFQPHCSEPAEFCQLWLYEVNSAVWKKWDCSNESWNLEVPSKLSGEMKFAGIGTKTPPCHAVHAIRSLLSSTLPAAAPPARDARGRDSAQLWGYCQGQPDAEPGATRGKQVVRRWRPKQQPDASQRIPAVLAKQRHRECAAELSRPQGAFVAP